MDLDFWIWTFGLGLLELNFLTFRLDFWTFRLGLLNLDFWTWTFKLGGCCWYGRISGEKRCGGMDNKGKRKRELTVCV